MKLITVIESLEEMGFFRNNSKIKIVVNKGKSLHNTDQLFECIIPFNEAKRFFGELDVIINRLENVGEYKIPTFWFLLAYDEQQANLIDGNHE